MTKLDHFFNVIIWSFIICACGCELVLYQNNEIAKDGETESEVFLNNTCRDSTTLEDHSFNAPGINLKDRKDMALVVYTPTHLSAFRQETKKFTFAGRSVSIRQRWEELGVAAVVWDAAVVLAEYLETSVNEHRLTISEKSVIELGAGTGLVGIVAALFGGHVVMTDRQVALDQLRSNMEENIPETGGRGGIISVRELTWGENLQVFPKPFEIIVGADIVYVEDTFPKLLQTIVHLSSSDTLVLLSCRIRYERDEKFINMLKEKFSVMEILHDRSRDIHVYEARLL